MPFSIVMARMWAYNFKIVQNHMAHVMLCHVSHSCCHGMDLGFQPVAVNSVLWTSVSEKDISEHCFSGSATAPNLRHSSKSSFQSYSLVRFFERNLKTCTNPYAACFLKLVSCVFTVHFLSLFYLVLSSSILFLVLLKGKMPNIWCRPDYMFCYHFHALQSLLVQVWKSTCLTNEDKKCLK